MLEALLEHEMRGRASRELTLACVRWQEYLLERRLFRRRTAGEVVEYDRKVGPGVAPEARMAEAIDFVVSQRDAAGRWPPEVRYPGAMPIEIDVGEGLSSRWNTLRALRVVAWASAAAPAVDRS